MTVFKSVLTAFAAGAVLTRAGVIRPLAPTRAIRIAGQYRQLGASPALLVATAAIRWPDRVAVIDDAGEVTYRQLRARADALARHMASEYGIGSGQSVALMCRNHRGIAEVLLAAGRLGADVLLVNTELPAHQLGLTLQRHNPSLVLHDDEFADRLAEADPDRATLAIWADGAPVHLGASRANLPTRLSKPGQLILLTSGTTGAPKGVPRRPHLTAFLGVTASTCHRLGLRAGTTTLVCPPAFHGMGLICLMLGLAGGGTVVLQRRFDASAVADAIAEHHVDHLVAVPAMLQRLTTLPGLREKAAGLTSVLSGASELSPVVAHAFMDVVGDKLFDGYGSSEVGIVTLAKPADLRIVPGTVGKPTLGTSILILDQDGEPVPTGQVGEIFIHSPMTFDGYTGGGHKPETHGHLSSGDLGHLDAEGRLFIDGRADDMIVSGGENVFPQPVESALLSHPSISDAAVVGLPDDAFGQRLRAFVVPADETVWDEDVIREYLGTRLTRYEQPRDLIVTSEIPRNATGKVLRKQLATSQGEMS